MIEKNRHNDIAGMYDVSQLRKTAAVPKIESIIDVLA